MALNLKSPEVDRLAAEVARLAGESKTEAVRRALEERRVRLIASVGHQDRGSRLRRFLEDEAWPAVPARELGKRLTRRQEEALLGYGKDGV